MDIQVISREHVQILQLAGRLDRKFSRELESRVAELIGEGQEQHLVDLAGVTAIDSDGIRCLLRLARRLEAGDGHLVLCRMPRALQEAFAISGVEEDFVIVPDQAAGLDLLSPHRLRTASTSRAAARLLGLRARSRRSGRTEADSTMTLAADLITSGGEAREEPRGPGARPERSAREELPPALAHRRRRPGAPQGEPIEPAGIGDKLSDWLSKLRK